MAKAVFSKVVVEIVKNVPRGKVVSYGQVAVHAGVPRGARAVGWFLRQTNEDIPWWRVVNNSGRISIKGNIFHTADEQRELLRNEGVEVGNDFRLDIDKCRYFLSKIGD